MKAWLFIPLIKLRHLPKLATSLRNSLWPAPDLKIMSNEQLTPLWASLPALRLPTVMNNAYFAMVFSARISSPWSVLKSQIEELSAAQTTYFASYYYKQYLYIKLSIYVRIWISNNLLYFYSYIRPFIHCSN